MLNYTTLFNNDLLFNGQSAEQIIKRPINIKSLNNSSFIATSGTTVLQSPGQDSGFNTTFFLVPATLETYYIQTPENKFLFAMSNGDLSVRDDANLFCEFKVKKADLACCFKFESQFDTRISTRGDKLGADDFEGALPYDLFNIVIGNKK